MLSPPFPVVHIHLLCLDHIEGEVAPHGQVSDLLPVCFPIVVGDQAYTTVNDGVGIVPGYAVMSEQGVQEGNGSL